MTKKQQKRLKLKIRTVWKTTKFQVSHDHQIRIDYFKENRYYIEENNNESDSEEDGVISSNPKLSQSINSSGDTEKKEKTGSARVCLQILNNSNQI